MLKKVGALGLMLTAGLLVVHPSVGEAQQRYGSDYYYQNDRSRDRDYARYEQRNFREEERRERKWREKEMREREKWERRNYRKYYNGYRSEEYRGYGYQDPYRPY